MIELKPWGKWDYVCLPCEISRDVDITVNRYTGITTIDKIRFYPSPNLQMCFELGWNWTRGYPQSRWVEEPSHIVFSYLCCIPSSNQHDFFIHPLFSHSPVLSCYVHRHLTSYFHSFSTFVQSTLCFWLVFLCSKLAAHFFMYLSRFAGYGCMYSFASHIKSHTNVHSFQLNNLSHTHTTDSAS